jgi:hypothetical protein
MQQTNYLHNGIFLRAHTIATTWPIDTASRHSLTKTLLMGSVQLHHHYEML